jgi:hypothetical protein
MIAYAAISILIVLLIVISYYCIKFGLVIVRMQDTLQESMDILDEKYGRISEILQRPLFFDSPEVRQVLRDIDDSRRALHSIALALSSDFEEDKA